MNNIIPRVADGKDKGNTYKRYMEKYNKAIKYKCFLEAIVIDYAMLEDRLLAFLHYTGVISRTHNKISVNKFCRPQIRSMIGYKTNSAINVNNISFKIRIVKALLSIDDNEDDKYLLAVHSHLSERISADEFNETLQDITKWCDIRNQYIHALLNKNYDALQDGLCEYAEHGLKLARKIDSYVKNIKRGDTIRKKFKIQ